MTDSMADLRGEYQELSAEGVTLEGVTAKAVITGGQGGVVGLGSEHARIVVYIANRPPLVEFEQLDGLRFLQPGEIVRIANETGNHWRKVFNIYAKLVFQLNSLTRLDIQQRGVNNRSNNNNRWQHYRDKHLLQVDGNEGLMFSAPSLATGSDETVHIITGKTYAKTLGWFEKCEVLNDDFMFNRSRRLIICPYFDYRQLSNLKIDRLVDLIESLT